MGEGGVDNMALQFPNITQPSYPLKPTWEDVSLKSQQTNGIVLTRAKFTRSRDTYTLNWLALPTAHYEILRNFYKNVTLGGSLIFSWVYPNTGDFIYDSYKGQTMQMRFTTVPNLQSSVPGFYSGSVTIEEV